MHAWCLFWIPRSEDDEDLGKSETLCSCLLDLEFGLGSALENVFCHKSLRQILYIIS